MKKPNKHREQAENEIDAERINNKTSHELISPHENDTRFVCMNCSGFYQLVDLPIRVTINTSPIIDHIAKNCVRSIIKSVVH